jgi:hypothetical protein
MNSGAPNHVRIPLLGSLDLGRLARRGAVGDDGTHLHWDRQNRRWVPHEDARLSGSPTSAEVAGPAGPAGSGRQAR